MDRMFKPLCIFAALAFVICSTPSFAAPKKLPKYIIGSHVAALPKGYATLHVPPGSTYYYRSGIYYAPVGINNYMIVRPPAGAVVKSIPWSYKKMIINGVPYFTKAGVCYKRVDQGYMVVPAPLGAGK